MNEPITFEGWRVPPGFISDGCTCAPDRWPIIDSFFPPRAHWITLTPACVLHDFQRRHAVVPVKDADARLKRFLIHLGAPHWLASIYWVGDKLLRPLFRATQPLPGLWREYAKPINAEVNHGP